MSWAQNWVTAAGLCLNAPVAGRRSKGEARGTTRTRRGRLRVDHRALLRGGLGVLLAGLLLTAGPVLLLRFAPAHTSSFMLQRLWQARSAGDHGFALHQRWTPLGDISPELLLAVLASEDQRFLDHAGFDIRGMRDAVAERLRGGALRGGSTLSQQVAKNLFLWPGKTWLRKGLEAHFTLLIELLWPKRRILEVYLNVAEWGDGVYGAAAAARRYFRQRPDALDAEQAALLATALPNPRIYRVDHPGQRMRAKQRWILGQMGYLRAVGTLAALR